jgi:hypothetical protein
MEISMPGGSSMIAPSHANGVKKTSPPWERDAQRLPRIDDQVRRNDSTVTTG